MQDLEMKKRVAEEIMALMDQKEGEKLKKHPKFMAAKLEVAKPEAAVVEDEGLGLEEESEELSPEMIKKLLEMVSGE